MHPRFDTEARIAVAQATDLARELGHREVGPDHLLLGLLANTRGTAYAALTDQGLTLDAARELVAAQHADTVDDEPRTDQPAEQTSYDDDREALRAIGIDLDRVRDAVRDHLGQDLADGWATRPERTRGRGRGRGREDRGEGRRGRGRHHHPHDHEGRGRRGPRSRRDDGPRFSRALRGLLRDVRRSALRDRFDDARPETPGLSGTRLLLALTRSDDPAVQAVLAGAADLEGLRARAEAAASV